MSRSRKSTAAEAKLKEKEYDRKRREKLKNCPETLEKLREKERLKYLKKKEKCQVKSAPEYNLFQATKTVTYRQWMYENSTYEKSGINNFTWNYPEPGHGKGAPDGVGGTLKRSADQAVAGGKNLTDLNVLKNVLSSKCPSIMLIEVSTAEIIHTDNLIKKSKSISTFPDTQKVRQFVFSNDVLEFRTLSCFDCVGKCQHFHLGYYKTFVVSDKDTPAVSTQKEVKVESNVKISKITPSEKNTYGYKVGDHVLITWNNEVYPGKIPSLSDDGALVRCMKKRSKCWKWPTVEDEELYAWSDVLRIIKPPKLPSRSCYFVEDVDEKK
ncbi:hypothetical protein JTB14_000264 [Gonioctena quinquepunctata]|nr:hypothetical protein JTB14_000264 [Gonioctena quinquepunctata]